MKNNFRKKLLSEIEKEITAKKEKEKKARERKQKEKLLKKNIDEIIEIAKISTDLNSFNSKAKISFEKLIKKFPSIWDKMEAEDEIALWILENKAEWNCKPVIKNGVIKFHKLKLVDNQFIHDEKIKTVEEVIEEAKKIAGYFPANNRTTRKRLSEYSFIEIVSIYDWKFKKERLKLGKFLYENKDVTNAIDYVYRDIYELLQVNEDKAKELSTEVKKLKDDRIYLYEIAKKLYQRLNEKENLESEVIELKKQLDKMEKKIIKQTGYKISDSVEYYFNCAKQKRGIPSLRDLEKGSDYSKSTWGNIRKDYEFILSSMGHLGKRKSDYPEKLYNELHEEFLSLLNSNQKKQEKNKDKSFAKEYKEY